MHTTSGFFRQTDEIKIASAKMANANLFYYCRRRERVPRWHLTDQEKGAQKISKLPSWQQHKVVEYVFENL